MPVPLRGQRVAPELLVVGVVVPPVEPAAVVLVLPDWPLSPEKPALPPAFVGLPAPLPVAGIDDELPVALDVLLPEEVSFMPVELHAARDKASRPPSNTLWLVRMMFSMDGMVWPDYGSELFRAP